MKRIIAVTASALVFGSAFAVGLVPTAYPVRASLVESRGEPTARDEGQIGVRMSLSGSATVTQIILQPGTAGATDVTLAGDGSLGAFTYHEVNASAAAPSGACGGPSSLGFPIATGAGVFRFQDGALLTTKITQGSVCVDLTIPEGAVTVTYQITGGTGRFKTASGTFAFTAKSDPVLFNSSTEPVLFAVRDGKATGTILLSQ